MLRSSQLLFILLVLTLLTGCALSKANIEPSNSEKSITIYASYDNEAYFYQAYGNLLLNKFPELSINLILGEEELEKARVTSKPIDLMIANTNEVQQLIDENYLVNLETIFTKTHLDTSTYSDVVLQAWSDSSGALYGISPNVHMFAIFYNSDLFNSNNVNYPTNEMTWEELLLLASQFDNEIVGFESTSAVPNYLLMQIASDNQWYLFNDRQEFSMDKERWIEGIEQVINLYKAGKVSSNLGERFFNGEAALYYGHILTVNSLIEEDKFNWGMMPAPVNPSTRNVSTSIYFSKVLAIPNESTDKGFALDVIRCLMSEEVASHYTDTMYPNTISTLKTKQNDYKGIDISAFWSQSIVPTKGTLPETLSSKFIDELYGILNTHLNAAIKDEISIDACVELIYNDIILANDKEKLRAESSK